MQGQVRHHLSCIYLLVRIISDFFLPCSLLILAYIRIRSEHPYNIVNKLGLTCAELNRTWSIYSQIISHTFCLYYQKPNSTCVRVTQKWHWPTTTHHPHKNSMLLISQLLLTRFWPNLKVRFLGPFLTDSNVTMTFVLATFVPATFVHIRNISANINPILTKLWKKVPGTIFYRF